MLPGGLFVSRPDFLRRVAGKQRAHDSLNLFGAACVSCVRHRVPQCGRRNVLPGIESSTIERRQRRFPCTAMDVVPRCRQVKVSAIAAAKQFVGPVTARQSTGRVQRHVHLLGILWLAFSALNAIGGVVVYIIANTLFAPGGGTGAPAFLHPLLSVVWDIRSR